MEKQAKNFELILFFSVLITLVLMKDLLLGTICRVILSCVLKPNIAKRGIVFFPPLRKWYLDEHLRLSEAKREDPRLGYRVAISVGIHYIRGRCLTLHLTGLTLEE